MDGSRDILADPLVAWRAIILYGQSTATYKIALAAPLPRDPAGHPLADAVGHPPVRPGREHVPLPREDDVGRLWHGVPPMVMKTG